MARPSYVLAIDQGTTGTTALLVSKEGTVAGRGYSEVNQIYPRPGWVEHDPLQIWDSVLVAVEAARRSVGCEDEQIRAVGIANQRETTMVWDAESGRPVHNAIVWQCRRTAELCEKLRTEGVEPTIRQKTGLPVDAYFSATKLRWLLDSNPLFQSRAETGVLRFGTVDSWLIWQLTGKKVHVTDHTNASRTLLFNLRLLDWDDELLRILGIPRAMLPRVADSSGTCGHTVGIGSLPAGIPVSGIAGDQQAALFGQTCFEAGQMKVTYGTGGFLLLNTGNTPLSSSGGLVTTIAWSERGQATYALEGSIFIAGAAIQWLRDELGVLSTAAESDVLAQSLRDNGGVYLVPAFVGLGAPYWDMRARGALLGLTRGSGRAHLARAALEAIAYQVRDVVEVMAHDWGRPIDDLRVDGGAAANGFLVQFQADILDKTIVRPQDLEKTGLGAAYLAGLGVGYWSDKSELAVLWKGDRKFKPQIDTETRERLYSGWKKAVERASAWA